MQVKYYLHQSGAHRVLDESTHFELFQVDAAFVKQ